MKIADFRPGDVVMNDRSGEIFVVVDATGLNPSMSIVSMIDGATFAIDLFESPYAAPRGLKSVLRTSFLKLIHRVQND